MKKLTIILIFLTLTGCASVWNPYNSEFRCTGRGNDGKCTDTAGAYKDSLNDTTSRDTDDVETSYEDNPGLYKDKKNQREHTHMEPINSSRAVYDKNRYETMSDLVKEDKPPIVIPPDVVRVLILPYTDKDNNMQGSRYSYFFATDPKWQFTIGVDKE
jgi:conjugal transfer pilus assembly protein TraV